MYRHDGFTTLLIYNTQQECKTDHNKYIVEILQILNSLVGDRHA